MKRYTSTYARKRFGIRNVMPMIAALRIMFTGGTMEAGHFPQNCPRESLGTELPGRPNVKVN